jgi:transcriptional regulator with XRE-family HTH domain
MSHPLAVAELAQRQGYKNINQFAQAAELTYAQAMRYWKSQVTQFDLEVLQRIAKALKVPIWMLFASSLERTRWSVEKEVQQEADIKYSVRTLDLRWELPPQYFQKVDRGFHVGITSDYYHIIGIALIPNPMLEDPEYRAAMGIDLPEDDTNGNAA